MSNSSTSASIVLLHDTLCVSMCSLSLSLFFYPSFPPSLPPLSLSPPSPSPPLVRWSKWLACLSAVLLWSLKRGERAREGRGGRGGEERREKREWSARAARFKQRHTAPLWRGGTWWCYHISASNSMTSPKYMEHKSSTRVEAPWT